MESGDSTSSSISRAQTAQLPDQSQVVDEAECIQPISTRHTSPHLCAREPAPLRPDPARSHMKQTLSRPHLAGATDATSANFPHADCRRKAMERSGGVVTPPHSAGMYILFGLILFGILVAS